MSFSCVLSDGGTRPGFRVVDIRARVIKQIYPKCLRLVDTQFSDAGAQRAAVEPKDLGRPVFSADFPLSLIEDSIKNSVGFGPQLLAHAGLL